MLTDLAYRYAQSLRVCWTVLTDHVLTKTVRVAAEVMRAEFGRSYHSLMVAVRLTQLYKQQELLTIDSHIYHVARVQVKHPCDASRYVNLPRWEE